MRSIVWDYDGTLALSIPSHRAHAVRVANLLGIAVGSSDPLGLRTLRSDASVQELDGYPAIAAFHRVLVARDETLPELQADLVSAISADLRYNHFIASSSMAAPIVRNLGARSEKFIGIFGAECGDKVAILRGLAPNAAALVTDSVRDVDRANTVSMSSIGVAWGIDSPAALLAAGCSFCAETPSELIDYLFRLDPRTADAES